MHVTKENVDEVYKENISYHLFDPNGDWDIAVRDSRVDKNTVQSSIEKYVLIEELSIVMLKRSSQPKIPTISNELRCKC